MSENDDEFDGELEQETRISIKNFSSKVSTPCGLGWMQLVMLQLLAKENNEVYLEAVDKKANDIHLQKGWYSQETNANKVKILVLKQIRFQNELKKLRNIQREIESKTKEIKAISNVISAKQMKNQIMVQKIQEKKKQKQRLKWQIADQNYQKVSKGIKNQIQGVQQLLNKSNAIDPKINSYFRYYQKIFGENKIEIKKSQSKIIIYDDDMEKNPQLGKSTFPFKQSKRSQEIKNYSSVEDSSRGNFFNISNPILVSNTPKMNDYDKNKKDYRIRQSQFFNSSSKGEFFQPEGLLRSNTVQLNVSKKAMLKSKNKQNFGRTSFDNKPH